MRKVLLPFSATSIVRYKDWFEFIAVETTLSLKRIDNYSLQEINLSY